MRPLAAVAVTSAAVLWILVTASAASASPAGQDPATHQSPTRAIPDADKQDSASSASTQVFSTADFVGRSIESAAFVAINLWASATIPTHCRWCDGPTMSFDGLNRLDAWGRGARWQHTARAAAMSTIATAVAAAGPSALPYVTSPFTSTSLGKEDVTESLMMVEAITAEMAVNGVVKSLAGRERPEAHLIFAPGMSVPRDANGSFYSGHSGTAFAGLFAYARVRQMHGKSPGRFWWLVALPAAAVTPYLRVAADKHYLTDVLTGAAVGGATGWLAPPLLHPRMFKRVAISPTVDQSGGRGVVSILTW